jgi:hypothetical protein
MEMIIIRPEDDTIEDLVRDYGMSRADAELQLAIMRGAPFDDVEVVDSDVDEQPPRG